MKAAKDVVFSVYGIFTMGKSFKRNKAYMMKQFEFRAVDEALFAAGGNVTNAAKLLKLHRVTVHALMRKHRISKTRYAS